MRISREVKPIRWAGLLLVLLVTLTFNVGLTAKPARAAASVTICYPVHFRGVIVRWVCVEIPLEMSTGICPRCPDPYAIDLLEDMVLPPDRQEEFLKGLTTGVDRLSEAAAVIDPRVRDSLRVEALDSFMSAADVLRDVRVKVNEVGFADLKANVLKPAPEPWLIAASTDFADGLRLLQGGNAGAEERRRAMEEFDEGFAELTRQVPIGR